MKAISFVFATILCALPLCSCYEQEQRGYPDKVSFSEEGGSVVVKGHEQMLLLCIESDGNVTYSHEEGDTICIEKDWLSARTVKFSHELTITAEPSNETKSRGLYIEGNLGDAYAVIEVKQKGR